MPQLSVNSKDYPQPEMVDWGFKSRLDNIQAAVLLVKLKYIDEMIERRANIAKQYINALSDIVGFAVPTDQLGRVWQEFHVLVDDRLRSRSDFVEFMKEQGIELLVRDEVPNHKLQGLGLEDFDLPVTERLAKEIVRLPLYSELTDVEVGYVIAKVKEFYGR
jgi:dTDP-4-amino-4,6-dideoxygalactose transaminase